MSNECCPLPSRYLQNAVAAVFPKDLKVTWEFVNTYFPSTDTLFRVDSSTHRHTCILTPYRLIDLARGETDEEAVMDPEMYVKYLEAKLSVLVFGKLTLDHDIVEVVRD